MLELCLVRTSQYSSQQPPSMATASDPASGAFLSLFDSGTPSSDAVLVQQPWGWEQ